MPPPPPFAAPPPLLALDTLLWLHAREDASLGGGPDAAAAAAHRALAVAAAVADCFTARGADPAGLAPRLLNWSILAAVDEATGRSGCREERCDGGADGNGPPPPPPPPAAGPPPPIPTLDAASLSYDAFVRHHLELGKPALISGVAEAWAAAREWVKAEHGGGLAPNVAALASALPPDTRLPVVSCERGRGVVGAAGGKRETWTLGQYAAWWEEEEERGREAAAAAAAAGRAASTSPPPPAPPPSPPAPSPLFYAKDWHLTLAAPGLAAAAYAVPPWFADDWLNGAADAERRRADGKPAPPIFRGGFRFAYLGPAGTATPAHTDVLASCSWSVNLAGEKAWALLAPGNAHLIADRWGRALAPGLDPPGPGAPDPASSSFPGAACAAAAAARLAQPPGAALFVPPAWPHTVLNSRAALSLNHNWVNAHTLGWTADALVRERSAAAGAVEDCRCEKRKRGGEGGRERREGEGGREGKATPRARPFPPLAAITKPGERPARGRRGGEGARAGRAVPPPL